jgi:hypothetical protein
MILKEKILFNKEECESIINDTSGHIRIWDKNDRRYNSQTIQYSENTKWIFDKLKTFFEEETGLAILKLKEIIHFHKFKEYNWFDKHNDVTDNRLYAVGVLLNDNFFGGDFKMYDKNNTILNKKIGNTYVFDVRLEHEITPITNGERYSLLWFLQNEHIQYITNKLI